jgi:ankyrin repeat protein
VNQSNAKGGTALMSASQNGHLDITRLLLALQDVEVNQSDAEGWTALIFASHNGHIQLVRLLLAHQCANDTNMTTSGGATARMIERQFRHTEIVRPLLARPRVDLDHTTADGRSALLVASLGGHGALVSLLIAYRAAGQVWMLAAHAVDSLSARLIKVLPAVAAQAAALCLPLNVAAALGATEEERAAADALASQSAKIRSVNARLAAAAAQTPEALARAREALARAPALSPEDAAEHAAREHEFRAALSGATTMAAFRHAQLRQLTARMRTLRREKKIVRGAHVSHTFAALFSEQRLEAFKLEQAERRRGSRFGTTGSCRGTACKARLARSKPSSSRWSSSATGSSARTTSSATKIARARPDSRAVS